MLKIKKIVTKILQSLLMSSARRKVHVFGWEYMNWHYRLLGVYFPACRETHASSLFEDWSARDVAVS